MRPPLTCRGRAYLLDGRRFEGVVLERGRTSGDAATLIFEGGRFRSTACDRWGYGDGACAAMRQGETVSFTAQTESPKYGKLRRPALAERRGGV